MRVVILSARSGWQTDDLRRALTERGHDGEVLPYEALVARLGTARGLAVGLAAGNTSIFDADAVLARIIPDGSLEQIIYRVNALHWLEESGLTVLNSPRCIERCVDKFYTTALLQKAGLATPETVVCEHPDVAIAAIRAMGDVVIKPIFGSMGLGMMRVSDPDIGYRVAQTLEQLKAVYYIQRTIVHEGRDIRVFVVGNRVVGAMERRAPDAGWRTNYARGGTLRPIDLPPALAQLAVRAADAVGADYAGVDLLPSQDGTVYVLEVNGIPGWQGLTQATGIDIAGVIVDHLAARVRARRPADAPAGSSA